MLESLGKWITNGTTEPFYARKTFNIGKEVKKAEAKVCGLGQFNFYINGRKEYSVEQISEIVEMPEKAVKMIVGEPVIM